MIANNFSCFDLSLNYHTEKSIYEKPEMLQEKRSTEPVYEEPTTMCKLQTNIAYEVPPPRIKTAENEAYGAFSKT